MFVCALWNLKANHKCLRVIALCLWVAIVQYFWPILHSGFIKCAFYFSTTWPNALLSTHYLSQKARRQSQSKVIHYGITNKPLYCDEKAKMEKQRPSEIKGTTSRLFTHIQKHFIQMQIFLISPVQGSCPNIIFSKIVIMDSIQSILQRGPVTIVAMDTL